MDTLHNLPKFVESCSIQIRWIKHLPYIFFKIIFQPFRFFFPKFAPPQNPLHHPFGMLPKVAAALLPLGRMLPSLHADADKQRQEDLQPPKSGSFKCTLVAPFRGKFFCLSASFQKKLTNIWIFCKPKILKLLVFRFWKPFLLLQVYLCKAFVLNKGGFFNGILKWHQIWF